MAGHLVLGQLKSGTTVCRRISSAFSVGRPEPPCERGDAPSISQALHLLNSSEIGEKIQHRHGRVRQLADSDLGPDAIIYELYLSTVNRFPTDAERNLMLNACSQNADRREVVEDLMWTLLNTKEFLFNH